MPERCTNPHCECIGSVKYSNAASVGTVNQPLATWTGKWKATDVDLSANPPTITWQPVYQDKTYKPFTSFTATWTADSRDASCITARGHNHGNSPSHAKPCPGTCEFESVPTGTATRSWERAAFWDPVTEQQTPPTIYAEVPSPAGTIKVKVEPDPQTVVVGWTARYGPWGTSTDTGFTGTTDLCQCKHAATTGGHMEMTPDMIERMKEQEKRQTDRPKPVTTPK